MGRFQTESLTLHLLIKIAVVEMQVPFPLVSISRTESKRFKKLRGGPLEIDARYATVREV
jgi:hypothetical protein